MRDLGWGAGSTHFLAFELATGLGSFLIGESDGRWLFWFHRAGGLALVVPLLWKAGIAVRSIGRRATLRMLSLLAAGFVFWRVQEVLSVQAAPSGSRRRFTGSREEASFAGNLHPVTNSHSDPIPRVDPDR